MSTIQFDPAQRCGVLTLFRYRERPAAGGGGAARGALRER